MDLVTDNWGDLIANFFFRDPNSNPKPPVRVKSGTKTVKITAVPPGVTPLPGSTVFASEALGTYSGSGTILTQDTSVSLLEIHPNHRTDQLNNRLMLQ